ncbi:hypothetical protein DAPPUDRAFT_323940 [Daphnia pulex]|uniref:Uncharacterized protein n=1 Tax=Daphnia pulex TaxID=6669 RepID=E9H095_DAPPU|nr:hypothetical protein DAPPUDRAFT_323940 [Daphnia pulex]|eukprot:EFX74763.1 hypothetical protein DAPPUDRAFT_323940 [Daphnia pulex]
MNFVQNVEEPDDYFSGQSESESGNESQQESDTEETDEDTQDMTKKQEKARARKKRYLNNKKSKKQKLDVDNLSKKFKEECSTGINVEACENKEQVAKIEEPVAEPAAGPSLSRKRRLARKADVTQKVQFGRRVQKALQCLGYRMIYCDPVKEHKAYREAQNDTEEEDVDSQEERDSNDDLGDYDYAETSSDSIE